MLHRFPEDKNRFREYDCVVAFDPDWTALSPAQTEMVRSWVADDSGGLIVVAGPVNTPKWSSRPRGDSLTEPIRRLYPVSFFGQSSGSIRLGRFGGEESFPLQFTRQAEAFDFLKFDADPETNRKLWDRVRVFGYYAVNEEKAGAQVIAHFSDPLTAFGNRQPIYLAAQMYGSGRVFFQASGELWRTRGLGPEFFEQYYTRLIRWTSQGRLYRNDLPWKLSLDRESCTVGEFVNIRATPNREHPELIRRDALPVTHVYPLATPGGTQERSTINLSPMIEGQDEAGFGARVRIQQAGTHRFQLVVGSGDESSIIEVSLVAKIPNLELQDSRRNDDLLEKFAETSGGKYLVYSGAETIDSLKNVHQAIPDHTVENVASLTDDINFKQKSHFALFAGFVVFLVVGWIMRRLNQLA